jgi:hypothetical protein
MNSRIHKGVPDSVRGRLWYILLDIDRLKRQQVRRRAQMLTTMSPFFYETGQLNAC